MFMFESKINDPLWDRVLEHVKTTKIGTIPNLQRCFAISYVRASKLLEWMEEKGIVSPAVGSKPRKVL